MWVIVAGTIIVHTCLFVKFLCVEEIRRVPYVVAFLDEHLAEWHIFDMLHHLAIKVGDVTTATQMVWVVVELHLLVCVRILEIVFQCQGTGLCSFGRTVVAAELSSQRAKCKLVCRFPSAADNANSNPCPST